MGHNQSKARSAGKGPANSQSATERLYPNLVNEFPTYGPSDTVAFRGAPPQYEACFGNPMPYINGPSYCYNPAASAPSEILCAEIPAVGQRWGKPELAVEAKQISRTALDNLSLAKQEDGIQTKQAESSAKQNRGKNNEVQRNNDINPTERKRCPNANIGCKLHFNAEEMKQHLKECLFRDVPCPLNGLFSKCAWQDKVKNIMIHFEDNHPENIGRVYREKALTSPRIIHLVELDRYKFLVHLKVDEVERKILVAVQAYNTQFCASKWTYEFKFKVVPHMEKTLEGTCFTAAVSVEEKFKKLQCRVLPMSICVMDGFKRGGLTYKYRILKKENVGVTKMLEANRNTTREGASRNTTNERASSNTSKDSTNKNTTNGETSSNRSNVWKSRSKSVAATQNWR